MIHCKEIKEDNSARRRTWCVFPPYLREAEPVDNNIKLGIYLFLVLLVVVVVYAPQTA
jgi:hypothetical protein